MRLGDLSETLCLAPSMKVPPKRKGNAALPHIPCRRPPSMKVPPKRKGNQTNPPAVHQSRPLNESPSEKEGKCRAEARAGKISAALNESPSEKEGKFEDCWSHCRFPDSPQ